MTRLRIAVAGTGAIGRRHVELVLADRNCTLAAIVDPAPSAIEIAAKAGVPYYSSLAELFARVRPDGVILATPNESETMDLRRVAVLRKLQTVLENEFGIEFQTATKSAGPGVRLRYPKT